MGWNSDTTYALGFQRIIAQIIGIWPVKSNDMSSKMQVIFILITQVWMCVDVIKQFIIKGHCGSILELVDIISTNVSAFIVVMKMIVITIYRENLYVIINSAIEDWSRIIDEKSRSTMLRYARIGRIIVMVQIFGVFTISCQVILDRLGTTVNIWDNRTNSSIQLQGIPLWPTCWIPTNISANHFTVYFIVQSVALLVCHNSYAIFNALFYSMSVHLCGQFQVLDSNLEYFHKTSDPVEHKYQLNEFIKRHNNLVMLANTFEETYNMNIMAEVGMSTIIICISGIVLLIGLQSSDSATVGAMIIRIFMLNITIFVHSYISDHLSRKTANLHITIYNIPWYNMSPSMIKDITFIMMRCSYPFNLTAGKIYNMNLHNYMGILKTIFSYFSVIRLIFE